MELLAPAGNLEKLRYAYHYGADAAYIGLHGFSLRTRADNFSTTDAAALRALKGGRLLYCALNIYFFDGDIGRLNDALDRVEPGVFDAFIVSDLGIVRLLQRRFPDTELHLSTQANCVNADAVRLYRDLGFQRVVPGRELSLAQIAAIKSAVPEVALEVFVHGAMCLAYSGRCFLSAWMAERSGNRGDCAHSCRWGYRVGEDPEARPEAPHDALVLEEAERPGEFYPIIEGEGFTEILSSRDLCMIDYLPALRDAGIDSLKIEGRMKSVYYTSVVTRAYRAALNAMVAAPNANALPASARPFTDELQRVSHRDYTTGFYFGDGEIQKPASSGYRRESLYLGSIGEEVAPGRFMLEVKNGFRRGEPVELLGPDRAAVVLTDYRLLDREGNDVERVIHHGDWLIEPGVSARALDLLRRAL
ncbi:MAG: U32 family peptidase [Spirochaetaceae bacterium]|nr:MAG: U32 family peptidase [Spirochaetaceae bacterium]